MKRRFLIFLALIMLTSLSACNSAAPADSANTDSGSSPSGEGETYTLTYNYYGPEVIPPGQFVLSAAQNIAERSNGRLTIDCYFNGTLLKIGDAITGCINGTADIVFMDSNILGEGFPLSKVFLMPYLETPPGKKEMDAAFKQLLVDCPELHEELNAQGLMYLAMMPAGGYHLHGVSELFDSPSKLAGKTIENAASPLVGALGGNGVTLDPGDLYLSLNTGLLDGQLAHFAMLSGFRLEELLTTHVIFSNSKDPTDYYSMYGGGLFTASMGIMMNKASFDALPPDLQEILTDEFGKMADFITARALETTLKSAIDTCVERGDTFVFIGDDDRGPWLPAIESVLNDWFEEVAAKGYDGQAIYNHLLDLF